VQDTNPAYRLYSILVGLRTVASENIGLGDAWAKVLGVPNGPDSAEFQVAKASIGQLVVDLHDEIAGLGGIIQSERYLAYLPRWTKVINDPPVRFGESYKPTDITRIDDLHLLLGLSDVLNARSPQILPPIDAVEDLLGRVQDLLQQVLNADDLDPQFRLFLLNHLAAIENALRVVRIRGQRGLDEVIGRVIDDATRRRGAWARFTDSALFGSFRSIFGALTRLATASDDIAKIEGNTRTLLGLPSGSPDGGE